MAKAEICSGVCGFNTTVEAQKDDAGHIQLTIESDCKGIQRLAGELTEVDPYREFTYRGQGPLTFEKAAEYFPNDVIIGNVEPAIIQTGTPQDVYELARIVIEKGKKCPGGFALSPGCDLPPKSPPLNVWMMTKALNDFGWYD